MCINVKCSYILGYSYQWWILGEDHRGHMIPICEPYLRSQKWCIGMKTYVLKYVTLFLEFKLLIHIPFKALHLTCPLLHIPYIANCLRWKSFMVVEFNCDLLEKIMVPWLHGSLVWPYQLFHRKIMRLPINLQKLWKFSTQIICDNWYKMIYLESCLNLHYVWFKNTKYYTGATP